MNKIEGLLVPPGSGRAKKLCNSRLRLNIKSFDFTDLSSPELSGDTHRRVQDNTPKYGKYCQLTPQTRDLQRYTQFTTHARNSEPMSNESFLWLSSKYRISYSFFKISSFCWWAANLLLSATACAHIIYMCRIKNTMNHDLEKKLQQTESVTKRLPYTVRVRKQAWVNYVFMRWNKKGK